MYNFIYKSRQKITKNDWKCFKNICKLNHFNNLIIFQGCSIPDWIMNLKNINRQEKKHFEKFPVKRERISLAK